MSKVELVQQLLSQGKEGLWWDFKQKFHENMAALVHDIICMSNVIHDGDRHIIFGISDSLKIIGLFEEDKNYSQADIINTLRTLSFSENNMPCVHLDFIEYDFKKLAVLTILNQRCKPYYLTKEYKKNGKSVRCGVIYSRTGDTNSPLDSCANPLDVRSMWHERFGLDLPPKKRYPIILEDVGNWKYDGIGSAHYELDPDFTIVIDEDESECNKYWWTVAFFEQPKKYNYYLKYKNVVIEEMLVVHYFDEHLIVPYPDIEFITYPGKDDGINVDFYCDLFYFKKNTLKYSFFKHLREYEARGDMTYKTLSTPIKSQTRSSSLISLPFFIINGETELETLQQQIKSKIGEFMKVKPQLISKNLGNECDPTRQDIEEIFAYWIFEQLHKR